MDVLLNLSPPSPLLPISISSPSKLLGTAFYHVYRQTHFRRCRELLISLEDFETSASRGPPEEAAQQDHAIVLKLPYIETDGKGCWSHYIYIKSQGIHSVTVGDLLVKGVQLSVWYGLLAIRARHSLIAYP